MLNMVLLIGRVVKMWTEVVKGRSTPHIVIADDSSDKHQELMDVRCWGDKMSLALNDIKIGDLVKVTGHVHSRAYQDRYYTDIEAYSVRPVAIPPAVDQSQVEPSAPATNERIPF